MSAGIRTQPADELLEQVDEFYTGYMPYYYGTDREGDRVVVHLEDPNTGKTRKYELSAQQVRDAFTKAIEKNYYLCCKQDIHEEGFGYGCAQDFGIIIQTACYGELVFG